ncbi:GNAT family N-acetyltransferase [Cetobacterium sp. SF1]|uniref:GNAT family N-acetyltransferase n=1 Tax=unclassified Cetobacterium TaxID=2630983 RepID=UPI003CEB2835
MKVIEVFHSDKKYIDEIMKNEKEHFEDNGAADLWLIKSFIRYGKLYILVNENDELLSVAQYMQVFGKSEVFLYGFSTVKKYQRKGYGQKLLLESEKLLSKEGIQSIKLTVDPQNIPGVNLYIKLGYKVEELQKDEYGKNIDRYLMEKLILS